MQQLGVCANILFLSFFQDYVQNMQLPVTLKLVQAPLQGTQQAALQEISGVAS